jgi:hypothetical protein
VPLSKPLDQLTCSLSGGSAKLPRYGQAEDAKVSGSCLPGKHCTPKAVEVGASFAGQAFSWSKLTDHRRPRAPWPGATE